MITAQVRVNDHVTLCRGAIVLGSVLRLDLRKVVTDRPFDVSSTNDGVTFSLAKGGKVQLDTAPEIYTISEPAVDAESFGTPVVVSCKLVPPTEVAPATPATPATPKVAVTEGKAAGAGTPATVSAPAPKVTAPKAAIPVANKTAPQQ